MVASARNVQPVVEITSTDASFPAKLARCAPGSPSTRLYTIGPLDRLSGLHCGVVGSRSIPAAWYNAARELAYRLSEAGLCVTTGMARGADDAAMRGAASGRAGALLLPPQGVALAYERLAPELFPGCTLLGSAKPFARFHNGLAIQRNYTIADFADALLLVYAGARSGSFYAVRRAISRGIPIFALSSTRGAPPGNRNLIRSGIASALRLDNPPEQSAERIRNAIESHRVRPAAPASAQLDWLAA